MRRSDLRLDAQERSPDVTWGHANDPSHFFQGGLPGRELVEDVALASGEPGAARRRRTRSCFEEFEQVCEPGAGRDASGWSRRIAVDARSCRLLDRTYQDSLLSARSMVTCFDPSQGDGECLPTVRRLALRSAEQCHQCVLNHVVDIGSIRCATRNDTDQALQFRPVRCEVGQV